MKISIQEVEKVALLSRLKLSEKEKEIYARQLSDILKYAEELNDIDTSAVEPTAHVLELVNVFREDAAGEQLASDKALLNAPETERNCFEVPRIL